MILLLIIYYDSNWERYFKIILINFLDWYLQKSIFTNKQVVEKLLNIFFASL